LAYSQTSDFESGDEYFLKKDYANAALEYEKMFFYGPCAEIQNQALLKKALAYKEDKKYLLSAQTLQRIPLYSITLREKDSLYYEILLCSYLADNFLFAKQVIINMDLEVKQNPSNQLLLMQILIYNELSEYDSAYTCVLQYKNTAKNLNAKDKYLLDSLYNYIPKTKSTQKAKLLSIFPGLGHIYAGYWFEGICAFTINAGVLGFGVYEFLQTNYLTAWLGGAGLLSATYSGQQKRAIYLVEKHNYIKHKEFNTAVKQILLK